MVSSRYKRVWVHLLDITLQRILHTITINFKVHYSSWYFNMQWLKVGRLWIKWFGSTDRDQLCVLLMVNVLLYDDFEVATGIFYEAFELQRLFGSDRLRTGSWCRR